MCPAGLGAVVDVGAREVHEEVDGAEGVEGGSHAGVDRAVVGDVGLAEQRVGFAVDCRLAPVPVDVGDDDVDPVLVEAVDDAVPDLGRTAGDDGGLATDAR